MHSLIKKVNILVLGVVVCFFVGFSDLIFANTQGNALDDYGELSEPDCFDNQIRDNLEGFNTDIDEINNINLCINEDISISDLNDEYSSFYRNYNLSNSDSIKQKHLKLLNIYFKYIDKVFNSPYDQERECLNSYIKKYLINNSINEKAETDVSYNCLKHYQNGEKDYYDWNMQDLFSGNEYEGDNTYDSGKVGEEAESILKGYETIINDRINAIKAMETYSGDVYGFDYFNDSEDENCNISGESDNCFEKLSDLRKDLKKHGIGNKIDDLHYESDKIDLEERKDEIDNDFDELKNAIYGEVYEKTYNYFQDINDFDVNRNEIDGNDSLDDIKENIDAIRTLKKQIEYVQDKITDINNNQNVESIQKLNFDKYKSYVVENLQSNNVFINNTESSNGYSFKEYIDYLNLHFSQIEENFFNKRIELERSDELIIDNPDLIEQLSGNFLNLGDQVFENILKKMNLKSQKQFYQIKDLSKFSVDDLSQKKLAIGRSFDLLSGYTDNENIKNKIQKSKENAEKTVEKIKHRIQDDTGVGLKTHKVNEGDILIDTGSTNKTNSTNVFKCFDGQNHIQLTGLVENSGEFIKYKGSWLTESGKPLKCNDKEKRKVINPKKLLKLTEMDTKLKELGLISYDQTTDHGEIDTDKFSKEVPDNQPTFIDIVYLQLKTISKLNQILKKINSNNNISNYFVTPGDYENFIDWTDKLLNYENKQAFIDAFSDSITFQDIYLGNKFIFGAIRSLNCKIGDYDKVCSNIEFNKIDEPIDMDAIIGDFDKQKNQFVDYLNSLKDISIDTTLDSNYQDIYSYFRNNLFTVNSSNLFNIGYNLNQREQNLEEIVSSSGTNLLKIYNFYNQINNIVKISPQIVYLDYIDKSEYSSNYKKENIENILIGEIPYTNSEEIYELEADNLELSDDYSKDDIVGDLNRVYEPVLSGGFDLITGAFYNTIQDGSTNKEKYSFLKNLIKFGDYDYTDSKHKFTLDNVSGLNYSLLSKSLIYNDSSIPENQNPTNSTIEFDFEEGFALHLEVSGDDLIDSNNDQAILALLDEDIMLGQDSNKFYINQTNSSIKYTDLVDDSNNYDLVWYLKNKNETNFENALFIKKKANNVYQKILEENINFNAKFDKLKGMILGSQNGNNGSWKNYDGKLEVNKIYRVY